MEKCKVNEKEYTILKLLGHGKGGYSYLASDGEREFVLKQIHHEPCSYYQFGNKLESELRDYERLKKIGIPMPRLIEVDVENERILKEYIDGDTVYHMVLHDSLPEYCISQVKEMCRLLYAAGLNIDYFPTNFVLQDGVLYYIDYECNGYMDEWNFENWGIKYWSKTEELLRYVSEQGDNCLTDRKYSVLSIREHPELVSEAALWFHKKWGIPEAAYLDSMNDCIKGGKAVPQWYLAMENENIIGGLGVIENDFHERRDLSPNVCAVYVEEAHRRKGIAGVLLNMVCQEFHKKGIDTLYLVTDHIGFYERYGWKFLCMVQDCEKETSRMYAHYHEGENT